MSQASEKAAELAVLVDRIAQAERLADKGTESGQGVAASAQSIAISLSALMRTTVMDEQRSYNRDRARESAFAAELKRLATGDGAKLRPTERTACLSLLARWLDDGYDGPPDQGDYIENGCVRAPIGDPV